MNKLKYCFDHIEVWIGQLFFCSMSLAIALQLVSRFTGMGIFFTEELARYSYVWIVFVCIALAEKQRAHFNVTAFTLFLKGKAEVILELIADIICTLIFLYLFYWSLRFWPFTHVLKTPSLEVPMTCITTCLCIGFFMSFVRRLVHTIERVKSIIKGGGK